MVWERTVSTLHLLEKDKKTPQDRMTILNKELAQVAYEILQARIFPNEQKARMANAKLELGDAMVQIHMLCMDMKLQPAEVLKQGVQHTFERFQDFEERGWGNADISKNIDAAATFQDAWKNLTGENLTNACEHCGRCK